MVLYCKNTIDSSPGEDFILQNDKYILSLQIIKYKKKSYREIPKLMVGFLFEFIGLLTRP